MNEKAEPRLRVKFYKTASGKEPVRDWLNDLRKDVKKIIGEDIRATQILWPKGAPLIKPIENKIWEIRSTIPNGIVRIFFTVKNEHIVLLHGFIKKSQKTTKQELEIARKRLKEWID